MRDGAPSQNESVAVRPAWQQSIAVDTSRPIDPVSSSLDEYFEDAEGKLDCAGPDDETHAFVNDLQCPDDRLDWSWHGEPVLQT